jgi:hypothetical protein
MNLCTTRLGAPGGNSPQRLIHLPFRKILELLITGKKKGVYVVAPRITLIWAALFTQIEIPSIQTMPPGNTSSSNPAQHPHLLHRSSRAAITSFIPSVAHREGGTQRKPLPLTHWSFCRSPPSTAVRFRSIRCQGRVLPSYSIQIWRHLESSFFYNCRRDKERCLARRN